MSRQPNIILCIADQLRAFELGCYGNPLIRTPHLDRLAREGVRFETAVSNSPVCMAGRSILLSGQYNRTCTGGVSNVAYTGKKGDFAMPEYPEAGRPHLPDPTLPEVLRNHGYDTAVIGKWHIHSWPHDIGFNQYLIPRVHHCHSAQHFTENGGPEFVPAGYSVDFEAERVAGYLQQHAGCDAPFFLYYSISPPHCPLRDAPARYLEMYDPAEIPLRPNVDLSQPMDNQEHMFKIYRWDFRYYSHHLPYTEPLPEDYDLRRLIADYYGLTTWVDDSMGRMMDALAQAGLDDNTLVLFTADHGDNLGSHGRVQKGNPHEESVRIPLILWHPRLTAREITSQVGSLVDIAPTLLDIAGANIPETMHGQSLAPVVHGTTPALAQDYAVIEPPSSRGGAVRTPTHMYHIPSSDGHTLADEPIDFYDIRTDPYQFTNLARTYDQQGVAGKLDGILRAWNATTPWMHE